jgi:hypothetical protein
VLESADPAYCIIGPSLCCALYIKMFQVTIYILTNLSREGCVKITYLVD